MMRKQAVRLAVECMERERRKLAIDAHSHEWHGLDTPTAISASERREKLAEAIRILTYQPEMEMANGN